ncbi:hypothetical protein [Pandoraea communis]|uniref:hypothetical protein n=1 Tax=Pandoraea communis TaxID=2508297 RepID=UPI0025A655DC|nr:hypothetical protein [Pandoraea communis]MDM8356172.1 hypothetical protein [Pandoraea communis]
MKFSEITKDPIMEPIINAYLGVVAHAAIGAGGIPTISALITDASIKVMVDGSDEDKILVFMCDTGDKDHGIKAKLHIQGCIEDDGSALLGVMFKEKGQYSFGAVHATKDSMEQDWRVVDEQTVYEALVGVNA